MANVFRFALSSASDLYISGVGWYRDGVLDVDANRVDLVARAKFLSQPYRATEIGIVDESTPKPDLPAVPAPPMVDPYPQYLDPTEMLDPVTGKLLAALLPPDVIAAVKARANHTGTQLSGTISDLTETIHDIVAAFIAPGTNLTKSYDDEAGLLTLNATGGGGGTPAEQELTRDVIGAALVQGAGINIVVNDDTETTGTITISSTAVLPTRQVATGAGLAGGGDLSANRTISIVFGSTAGTAVEGNDPRLSDARTPTTHTHTASQISDATALGISVVTASTAANARAAIGAGTSSLALGTTASTALPGNHASTTNARTPTAHATTHATGGTDALTPAQIGAAATAHTHTSAGITDLTEAVQDIVAAFFVAGVGVTVSYDDVANTYTVNATGGGGGTTDPEIVRDVIGTAIVAGAGIQVTVNDVGDSITIASTAVLPTRSVTAGTGLTGGGDLSVDRTLAVSYGNTAGTAVQGNDARVVADQVAGTASIRTLGTGAQQAAAGNHSHSGLTADQVAGTASIRTLGTGAQQAAAGNDSRFTNARTPTAHAASHNTGGSDPLTPANIGAAAAAHQHAVAEISNSTVVGRAVMTAVDAPAARTAIGLPASVATLDRPGGYQADGTRLAAYMFGNGGESTFTDRDNAWQRIPFQLPVATTEWRLRFSNKNPAGVASTGTWSIGAINVAETFRNTQTGDPTGWISTPQQAVAAGSTMAGSGEYVTPWVSASNLQFSKPGTLYTISHTWTKAAGSPCYYGSGGSFYSTTMADATATAPAFTYFGGVAFNVTLEYKFAGSQRIGVALGDSILEGYGARFNYMSWAQRLSMRLGIPMAMSADWGSTTNDWSAAFPVTEPRWQRIKDAALNIDFAISALGSNDAGSSVAIATYQTNINTILARVTSEWGVRDKFLTTIVARGLATGPEAVRQSYNTWLRSGQPTAALDVFDFADLLDNVAALRTDSSMDGLHWNPQGHHRASRAILL